MNRFVSGAAVMFGLALLATPEPAGAQWSAAQPAACQGEAQRLCAQSLADPGQLTACMRRNASKVSKGTCKSAGPVAGIGTACELMSGCGSGYRGLAVSL
jgi:hypothetical protein